MHGAKIDKYIDKYLNGRPPDSPPADFPITSQVDGEIRELRVRFAGTRYRILFRRSGNLIVLLHAFAKKSGAIPPDAKKVARQRIADFKRRMDADPRTPPRAAGRDAPRGRR